jgi:hypothetical protein
MATGKFSAQTFPFSISQSKDGSGVPNRSSALALGS